MVRIHRTGFTASIDLAYPAIASLETSQIGTDALVAQFELTRADFEDIDRRIDQAVLCELWDRAAALSGDPRFGLHAIAHRRHRLVSNYVLRYSDTLGDLVRRGLRLGRIWQEGRDASLDIEGDRAVLRWRARSGVPFSRAMSEYALAAMSRAGQFAGPGSLLEVRFPFQEVGPSDELERFFGADLVFDTGEQALVFPAALLDRPNPHADAGLLAILERHADQLLERLPQTQSFVSGVRQSLERELPSGTACLESVAKQLALSSRTLRRRLADEGTTFQALLDDCRRELAIGHLRRGGVTIEEVAWLLGFHDAAAFGKAFKRWTGVAPSEYRRHASPT